MELFDDLQWRGLVYQWTGDETALPQLLSLEKISVYIGFDPSSDSLTIGNLLVLMLLRRFQLAGHRPLPLVGGATGMIGDPSGKSAERNLLDLEQLAHNKAKIRAQMERFFDFEGSNAAVMVDNLDWFQGIGYLEFLRDVGKHVTVNTMLARDSVKGRIESENGISYTEFSYMLMQAYDFVHLSRAHGCVLQCGASDQYGNIVQGIDLARRLDGTQLYGLAAPLVTRSDGQKMGKTAEGAIWLDPAKTSPYRFYQWFVNLPDADAGRFLRYYTLLPHEEILDLEDQVEKSPASRAAQKKLALELTALVHGQDGLARAQRATEVLFGGSLEGLSEEELLDVFGDVPSLEVSRSRLGDGFALTEALADVGLASSRSDARRKVDSGGVYINNVRCDKDRSIEASDLATESVIVLRSGKRSFALIRFVS
jgi:tyrosyl-tRNA synthetase